MANLTEKESVQIPRWILQAVVGVLLTALIGGQINLLQRVRAAETQQAAQDERIKASIETAAKQFEYIEKRLDRIEAKIDKQQ